MAQAGIVDIAWALAQMENRMCVAMVTLSSGTAEHIEPARDAHAWKRGLMKQTWVCPTCSKKLVVFVKVTEPPVCYANHRQEVQMEDQDAVKQGRQTKS
jgi:hypothetical protein